MSSTPLAPKEEAADQAALEMESTLGDCTTCGV